MNRFVNCFRSKTWNSLKEFFIDTIDITLLTPQSVIFEFGQSDQELFLFLHYILLLFKYYVYVPGVQKVFHFWPLLKILRTFIF